MKQYSVIPSVGEAINYRNTGVKSNEKATLYKFRDTIESIYESFEGELQKLSLEERKEAIISALRVVIDRTQETEISQTANMESLADFYTIANFSINSVIKNMTTLTLNESDSIGINEPVTMIQQFDGKKYLAKDEYETMNVGTNYVIYLKDNGIYGYSIINRTNGSFNMDETNASRDITNTEDIKHSEFKKAILDKYSKFLN
ncbi:MAG: hypothetical protein K0S61_1047 [Anaerocolumna sp.]|jgi:hypothetical protein|nr:hypothetical protein [Anaerocolumna sp.]